MTKNHPSLAVDPYYDGVPAYMTEVYDWAYVDPKWVRALDHNWVVRVLLFLNDQRLMRAYLNEIDEGMRVWQLAHVLRRSSYPGGKESGAKRGVSPDRYHADTDRTWNPQAGWYGLTRVIRSDAASFASG